MKRLVTGQDHWKEWTAEVREVREKAVTRAQLSYNQGGAGRMGSRVHPRNCGRRRDRLEENSRAMKEKTVF